MQTGRIQQPFISENIVRDALDGLVRVTHRPDVPNPLQFLTLIDVQLADPTFPSTERARQYALRKVLTGIISNQYIQHLQTFDLEVVDDSESSALNVYAAADRIAEDIKRGTPELIGWSFLFYHFVRTDLAISPQTYCRFGNIEERTLRRYHQHAIKRLTDILTTEEWRVRKLHFVRILTSLIPQAKHTLIIGRSGALSRLHRQITEGGRQHLLITGASGIGKTALVSKFLIERIEQNSVDKLVWINAAQSADEVRLQLRQDLLADNPRMTLNEYFTTWRTYIVLDGIEQIQTDINQFNGLLANMRNAIVLMTSRIFSIFPDTLHLTLEELTFNDVRAIIESEFVAESSEMFDWHVNKVWRLVGGNPLAAKIASRHLQFFGYSSIPAILGLDLLYDRIYREMDSNLQRAWLAMGVLPASFAKHSDLMQIGGLWAKTELMRELSIRHLVETRAEADRVSFKLPPSAYHFIANLYITDREAKYFLDHFIADMADSLLSNSVINVEIIEQILSLPWLEIGSELRRQWINSFYQIGIQVRHFAIWAKLLQSYSENLSPSTVHLAVAYGGLMRHLCNWAEANAVIERVVSFSGERGLFRIQAEALVELVKLLRLTGDYTRALELLTRIDEFPLFDNPELMSVIVSEKIQIGLDTGALDRVGGLLKTIEQSKSYDLLRAEYFLRVGQYKALDELIKELMHRKIDNASLARLYILSGNSNEQQGRLDDAYNHFYIALTILEQEGTDHFAIARTRTNLGAIALQNGSDNDARTLLESAQATQLRLQDRVGLAATRHNLHLLNRNFIS